MALYRQPEKCFLSLLREIRDEVYRLCLLTRHTKRAYFLHPAIPHSLDLAILRICRQIHEESSHILYCENAFVRIVTDLELQATDIAARGVACISSGDNTIRCTKVHPSGIDYNLRLFCDLEHSMPRNGMMKRGISSSVIMSGKTTAPPNS